MQDDASKRHGIRRRQDPQRVKPRLGGLPGFAAS